MVDQTIIEIQAFIIRLAATGRQNTGPRQGKPEIGNMHLLDKCDIFTVTMIEITCHICTVAVFDFSSPLGKRIPNRRSFAVGIPSTLRYETSGSLPPLNIGKIRRESGRKRGGK